MPRRRKRSAWGSIAQVDSQTWRIRYWGKDSASGTYRRQSCTVRGSRLDAERKRSELMVLHCEDAPCPTVGRVWDTYAMPDLEARAESGDLAGSTLEQYRAMWRKHAEPQWGAVQCDAVKPLEVQQWLSSLSLGQAKWALVVTKKALDYAVRYGWCKSNPFRERYLMPSKSTVTQQDKGIWSLDELGELWHRLWGTWVEPAFLLSAFGSCRVGESLAPLARDVELASVDGVPVASVAITGQVDHRSGRIEQRVKTDDSARVVVIVGRAALRIAEIAASLPPDCPLTNDGMGGSVPQWRLGNWWGKKGMGHPYRNLRNSWQTWMRWELRVPVHYIEPLMGHRVPGTTGLYYDRPTVDMFRRVVADAYRLHQFDADWWWAKVEEGPKWD